MTFEYGNLIVQRKAQGHRKEGEKEFNVVNELVKSFSLYASVGEPIAEEEDDGRYDEEAGHLKNPSQMAIGVFYVQHGNAQQGNQEHAEEHRTVQ